MTTTENSKIFTKVFTAVMALTLLADATSADAQDREGRWELNDMAYLRLNYTSQWMEIGNADGTPRFDVRSFEVGWMF